jgi:SAM-dependent methyltransferase
MDGMNASDSTPYQLRMFRRSLKKRLKVNRLCRHLGEAADRSCLLVTCGDNNGAMNFRLRSLGGQWTWADVEPDLKDEMERLLGEPVLTVKPAELPFPAAAFDVVMTIDVHEHLDDPEPFCTELKRVVRPDGTVIVTVPNGNPRKLATRIKRLVGMTPQVYGHRRWGYDVEELSALLTRAGLEPVATSNYSRFFTEMVELLINFLYVKILKRGGDGGGDHAIAPGSEKDLRRVEKSYRLYSLAYPFFRLISALDALLFFRPGYAVVVECRNPGPVPRTEETASVPARQTRE